MTDQDGSESAMSRRGFIAQSAGALTAVAIAPTLVRAGLTSAEPLRVGIAGVGRRGRALIAELQTFDEVTLVAIADSDARRLTSAKRRAPDAQAFESAEAMIDSGGLDAVFVATPTHLHRAPVERALSAALHVYCEAPIAHTREDARAIARAARASDKVVQAGFLARSNPVYELARTFYRSDAVRDPATLRAQHHAKTSWRTPARDPARDKALNWRLDPEVSLGLAGEWGGHQFDVFHWYLGQYPERVRGGGAVRLHEDGRTTPDTVWCQMDFPGGVPMLWDGTLANSYGQRYEVLHGTNAAIKLGWSHGWMFKEADAPTQGWEVYANRQQFHRDEGITLIADATQLASQGKLQDGVGLPHDSLWYGIESFLRAILEGSTPSCTPDEGFRATSVAIAAADAVRTGETIDITPEMLKV
ncbi:MAG: Gfo/Idh/MocA family oxidoreductase [Planctomycetota bacterium]